MERRQARYEHPVQGATEESIFGGLRAGEFYEKHGVEHEEEYVTTGRGVRLFKQGWEPTGVEARASVLVLHGFSEDSSWLVQLTAVGIAKRGFSVHAFDFPGHGRSDGPPAHIPDLAAVADDALHVSRLVLSRRPSLPLFLYAESLGAAAALLAHLRASASDPPSLPLAGLILQGAMCGISRRFLILPPGPTLALAALAAWLLPTWHLCPTPDNVAASYSAAWKRTLVKNNPLKTAVRPDAATGYDMMRVARLLQSQAHLVSLPFLAIHGDDDRVCDLACVQALFDKAASTDKTLKVYRGMGHMFVGESKELTDTVFSDMIAWLEERTPPPPPPPIQSS